jgi:hypothetical protein
MPASRPAAAGLVQAEPSSTAPRPAATAQAGTTPAKATAGTQSDAGATESGRAEAAA